MGRDAFYPTSLGKIRQDNFGNIALKCKYCQCKYCIQLHWIYHSLHTVALNTSILNLFAEITKFLLTLKIAQHNTTIIAQKVKYVIKDFFSKCVQFRRKLRILSHLLNKSLMENFIFYLVYTFILQKSRDEELLLYSRKLLSEDVNSEIIW